MEIIHIVLGKANPQRMNGVNRVVNELATQQALSGITVSVWGITADVTHNYPERPYFTKLFSRSRNPFLINTNLAHAILSLPSNIIFHIHGGFIPAFYAIARFLHKHNLQFVFTPHGSYNIIAMQKSMLRKKIYFKLFESRLLKWALAIHCLGKSEQHGLQQIFSNNKSVLIPYGFTSVIPGQQINTRDNFIVGFCGRLDIYTKGLDLLFSAFRKFCKEVPTAELWIIGNSQEREELEEMADELGITNNVVFWGSKFGEEKLELLQQVKLFVHPSRNEGLPNAVLEALSLGIPCVITEATNVADPVREYDCGLAIGAQSDWLLYRCIRGMYDKIQANGSQHLSENAKRMVREVYNWKKILLDFDLLYKRA